MKSNKLKWPLLVLCLSVWAAVFYTLFADGEADNPTYRPQLPVVDAPDVKEYNLSLDYPDPFLGSDLGKRKATLVPQPTIASRPASVPKDILAERAAKTSHPKKPKSVRFPQIHYKGYVESTGQNIALVDFDGKAVRWQKGRPKDGIHLLSVHFDSIRISKDGATKTIFRE